MNVLLRELMPAVRSMRQRPALAAAAVLSLALGIGVNTAVFSVFDRVLLTRLPVDDADRLVVLSSPGPRPGGTSTGDSGGTAETFSYPLFRDLERLDTRGLSRIVAHRDLVVTSATTDGRRRPKACSSRADISTCCGCCRRLAGC